MTQPPPLPTIIKATGRGPACGALAAAPFHFEDMAQQAEAYLGKIRDQASQMLSQAAHDAQAIRQRAEAEGRRAAGEAVERLVEQEVGRQVETLLPALGAAVDEILQAKQAWLAHWEQRAVHLAAAIAARVIRRELAAQPDITLVLVQEALELAAGSPHVRVRVNPADHASLGDRLESLVSAFSRLAPAELVADPTISPGGCRLETQYGAIDQQFAAQLARIEVELTS